MTRARDLAAGTFELATGGVLKLETSDTTVTDGSVLGKIEFKAPDEASGTDAILVGAAIEAVAEGTFAADNNATELVFKTGASAAADAKMTLTSGGNLGIGTSSPSRIAELYGTSNPALRLNNGTDVADIGLASSAGALLTGSTDGALVLARSGANSINLGTNGTNRLTIDSSGNVGIGTSSPSAPLHLYGASNQLITVESTDANANIAFKDNSTTNVGQVGIKTDDLFFATGTTERMRLDSSGNLLVGKTATGISAAGHSYKADGTWEVRRDLGTANSSSVGYLSRGTTDGSILTFYKDTTAVGSIGVSGGNLTIDGGSAKVGLAFRGAEIRPRDNGADDDDGVDLGSGTYRFKDVYLSGGVYLGGTGSANKLDDYEEGTWTPVFSDASSGGNAAVANSGKRGIYTKIGNTVYVLCQAGNLVTTGMTGGNDLYIQGLPFTPTSYSSPNMTFSGAARLGDIAFSGYVVAGVVDNQAYARLSEMSNGEAIDSITVNQLESAAADITFSMTYTTAS